MPGIRFGRYLRLTITEIYSVGQILGQICHLTAMGFHRRHSNSHNVVGFFFSTVYACTVQRHPTIYSTFTRHPTVPQIVETSGLPGRSHVRTIDQASIATPRNPMAGLRTSIPPWSELEMLLLSSRKQRLIRISMYQICGSDQNEFSDHSLRPCAKYGHRVPI